MYCKTITQNRKGRVLLSHIIVTDWTQYRIITKKWSHILVCNLVNLVKILSYRETIFKCSVLLLLLLCLVLCFQMFGFAVMFFVNYNHVQLCIFFNLIFIVRSCSRIRCCVSGFDAALFQLLCFSNLRFVNNVLWPYRPPYSATEVCPFHAPLFTSI